MRTAAPAGLLVAVAWGCANPVAEGKGGLLPPPPAGQIAISDYRPAEPLVERAPGVLARARFTGETAGGVPVAIEDLNVAPSDHPLPLAMRGGAVVEVRAGEGVVSVGATVTRLAGGTVFSVSDKDAVQIQARGGPLVLHAYVFGSAP